ncbi:MAG: hypothetical protein WCN98_09525 [Verrucomicrobiaceae bacterium]
MKLIKWLVLLFILLFGAALWITKIDRIHDQDEQGKALVARTASVGRSLLETTSLLDEAALLDELVKQSELNRIFTCTLSTKAGEPPRVVIRVLKRRVAENGEANAFVAQLIACDGRTDVKYAVPFSPERGLEPHLTASEVNALGSRAIYKTVGMIYFYSK